MDEATKQKIEQAGKDLLKGIEKALGSAEGRSLAKTVVHATLTAAETAVEACSPGLAVPFEKLAFGWLDPKVEAFVDEELAKLENVANQPEAKISELTPTEAADAAAHAPAVKAISVAPGLSAAEKAEAVHKANS